jgi:PAS domain S-box-containing protein
MNSRLDEASAPEQKNPVEVFQRGGEHLRLVIDTIPAFVWSASPDGSIEFLNQRGLDYTGFSLEQLRKWNWKDSNILHPDDLQGLFAMWSAIVASGQPGEIQARMRRYDGEYRWFLFRVAPLRDESGRLVSWWGIDLDIHDRIRAEDKLRQSEAYLAEAQRLSRTGSFGWNVATGALVWSDETYCILGYERATKPTLELVFKRIDPDDVAFVRQTLDHATHAKIDLDFEHRLLMPDGSVKQVRVLAQPSRGEAGALQFVGAIMDITEQKLADQAMRAAKVRFEGILAIADDAIISVDSTQHIVLFNQGAQKVFGYAEDEVMGKPLVLLLPQGFAHAHRSHIDEFAKSAEISRSMGQRSAVFGRRKDGGEFPAEASISKLDLGKEVVFTVILRDITEQKRLENRLRQSERNLAEGQRLTKTGSWILDYKTGNTDWSVETCRIFGFPDPPPSPHYSEFRARVRPEDREAVDRGLRESFETGEPRPLEYIFILPDGVRKNIETISQPVSDERGAVVRLMGTVMDVTERKAAAEALRASEHLALGQLDALKKTLDALSRESEPEKFLEHVLCTIAEQLSAHSIGVWEMNKSSGSTAFVANYENAQLQIASEEPESSPKASLWEREHPVWAQFFLDGKFCVMGRLNVDPPQVRIENGQENPWHDWQADAASHPRLSAMIKRLSAAGIITTLCVPLFVAGNVTGLISIRFKQSRSFRQEEIELTRALSHQAMLAIQLMRLSQQSRQSAVIAERNRMARDIHDTLAQGLTGVIMQLEAAKGAAARGDCSDTAMHIERAGDLARSSLGEARRSVRALRPRSLKDGTLYMALEDLLKRMSNGIDLNAELRIEGEQRAIPPQWEEGLLRIAQESLTNTIKHSQARNFRVTLDLRAEEVGLQLVDDGLGFDPQEEHDGFGLIGMKERADQIGGRFVIRSKRGVGTEILVTLKNSITSESENGHEQH